jgi:flagellar hook assembly protein FlgD
LLAKRVSAGYHNVVWNGTDNDGRPVGSGVYLVQMQSSSWRQVQKIMLLK